MASKRRGLPEINAGSMADIAFLLLIFFLVTTTMDQDTGIARKLPPMPEEEMQEDDSQIHARNIYTVLINSYNQLLVEGELMDIRNLREAAKEFIVNPNNRADLPALEAVTVPYFGTVKVTKKHVISLQNDNGTAYKTYIAVQNELAAAYRELRDNRSLIKFGKKFSDLNKAKQKEIKLVLWICGFI